MKKFLIAIAAVLYFSNVIAQTVTIIPQNSSWKYLDNGSNQGTSWRASNFNDSSWPTGNAEFGYGDGGETTLIKYGSIFNRYRTTYFRKTFSVSDPNLYTTFTLGLLRDDGAVVYLNGNEIARSNMPTGTIDYRTLASSNLSGTSETTFYSFTLNKSSFVSGNNVIAVEIHQATSTSNDLSFNLKLDAASTTTTCATPTSLTASSITASTATLSWGAVANATSYNIQYRPVGTSTWAATTSTTATKSLTGLAANSNYEFQVQAVCSVTGVYSASANFTTLSATCGTPVPQSTTSITTSSATLSWSAVTNASSYNIQYRIVGTSTWTATTSATTTKSLTGLTASSNYEFQVQAVCSTAGAFSPSANFTTLAAGGAEFLIAANSVWKYLDNGSNQGTTWCNISFDDSSWKSGNAELGYGDGDEATVVSYGPNASSKYITTYFRKTFSVTDPSAHTALTLDVMRDDGIIVYLNGTEVYRNNMPTGTVAYNTLAGGNTGSTTTWYTSALNPTALLAGTNIVAVEIHQQDPTSSDISFNLRLGTTTSTPSCPTPSSLSSSSITVSTAILSWTAITSASSYNIQYRVAGTTTWTTTTSTTATKSLTGLTANSNYEFQVQAVCSVPGNYSASANFTTLSATCGTPGSLSATAITSSTATLSWTAITNASNYNIQYRIAGTPTWTTTTSTTTTKSLTGLTANSNYEFQVQAVCSTTGAYSASANFTTLSTTCGTPASLSTSSITSSSAVLSWSAIAGASSYNIQYRVVGTSTWTTTTSTTPTKSLTGLTANSNYEFQVQAICSVVSAYSSTANFTTLGAGGTEYFIAENSTWKYLDNGTNQGTAWRNVSFSDAAWASGNAELGYGDGDEATVVSYGPNASSKYITTYFRKSFSVANPSAYTSLTLDVVRDDGVVVYLNGTEVYRDNMPTGTIAYNTLAGGNTGSGSAWHTATLNPAVLLAGTNVLAIEVHQQDPSSSDISFNARLYASSDVTTPVPIVTRGAYLQKLTPNSITIRWRTNIACDSNVQYGTGLTYGSNVSDPALTTNHTVTLTNLSPGTKYFYSIGTSTQMLQGDAKNNFYTAPVVGSTVPVRIWGIGDFGNGSSWQLDVRNAYTTYTGATPTNLWIWFGDNAYNLGSDLEYQNNTFAQYPDQFKSIPLFPTPGNHDYGELDYQSSTVLSTNFPYFSIFTMPQNGESGGIASNTPKYYSYNYANIHFISLDSYGALNDSASPMYNWLNNDLAANTQRWTVVYFHHTPYSKGTHNSDTELEMINMRKNIIPLLESYHVDVVLSGHSHVNERSYLIKGHYGNANTFTQSMKVSTSTNNFTKTPPFDGTVYAVCGTSSGPTGDPIQSGYPMPCMYFNSTTNACSLVIDVNGDSFSCKYLASTGVIVDQFNITKSGSSTFAKSTTERVENSLNVFLSKDAINLNYILEENANVKIDLFNTLGQNIVSFDEIPAYQLKGFHNFDFLLSDKNIAKGIYILKMKLNDKVITKKVYLGK